MSEQRSSVSPGTVPASLGVGLARGLQHPSGPGPPLAQQYPGLASQHHWQMAQPQQPQGAGGFQQATGG